MLLVAEGVLTMFVFSIGVGAVSVFMVMAGLQMIRTKTAGARKLEKLMAVIKGYIFLIGGIVIGLMCIVLFFLAIYTMIFGPINLAKYGHSLAKIANDSVLGAFICTRIYRANTRRFRGQSVCFEACFCHPYLTFLDGCPRRCYHQCWR